MTECDRFSSPCHNEVSYAVKDAVGNWLHYCEECWYYTSQQQQKDYFLRDQEWLQLK